MKKLALYLLVGATLVGCGGDDNSDFSSNPSPNPNPSIKLLPGIYSGVTNEGEYLEGLVDDDNRMWFTYFAEQEGFIGFVKSNEPVVLNNSKFKTSGKNYPFDSRSSRSITINGNVQTSKAIVGTIDESGSDKINYNIGYDEASSNRKQTFDMINNRMFNIDSYGTGRNGSIGTTITFTTDGKFTGSDNSSCISTGKFTPAASGRYFVSTMTFSGSACSGAGYDVGQTYTGVAVINKDNELKLLSTDSMKNKSIAFIGSMNPS